ncbi:uncharacterized protein LOC129457148 [Periophthalmus magnuspinnatus]|uniref:uncharacterized protein LOC129457148 n=1 Tax=Periophthalmus magnuspinnatus TaxID=409849 RepID=UPI002436E610|nr:uncharacterized protein LOC129457148 [Periophthalmus magnuspinnatus]
MNLMKRRLQKRRLQKRRLQNNHIHTLSLVMGTYKTSTVNQDSGLKKAQVGDSVTLHCSCADDKMTFFSWYQQKLGEKPELISKWVKGTKYAMVEQVFQQRFSIFRTEHKKETNNLNITDVQTGDSASYFCVVEVSTAIEFGEGVFVHVQSSNSNIKSVVQEQAEKKLWHGEPLELSCMVESDSFSGKRRFFWLKHRPSQPAIIYPANEDCETSRKNCTVKLDIETVEPAHAGTYYCVLSLCGELLFGNGTSVVIKEREQLLWHGKKV